MKRIQIKFVAKLKSAFSSLWDSLYLNSPTLCCKYKTLVYCAGISPGILNLIHQQPAWWELKNLLRNVLSDSL